MANLLLTVSVEGSPEQTEILNTALTNMQEIHVVEHEDVSRGILDSGLKALKWVVELAGNSRTFVDKLFETIDKQLAGATVKIQCPPGITVELTNVSKGQVLDVMNAALSFSQSLEKKL